MVRAYFGTMCSNFDASHKVQSSQQDNYLLGTGESPVIPWRMEIRPDSLPAVFGKSQSTRLGALVANCSSCGLPGRVSWSLA